ncbi:MAG: T9SS type A sorting domain-containing protein [Dysgonamonadaceae bacterium]|nr:T9SS type A sorting domain-containing protein [Dysgonamonadaceae bacterium]
MPPVGSGKLSIYTSGKQITVAGVDVAEMNLLNLSGKSLKNQTASQTMNVNHLLQGIYLMRIRTSDESVFNHKILVD